MTTIAETTIEADPNVPIIRMRREFNATPEQLFRAHTDPRLFARWAGPNGMHTRIEEWDARSGGSWRYVSTRDEQQYTFRGCFHDVRPDRIVQTFTFEGQPDGVALQTLRFENLDDGRALRYSLQALVRLLRTETHGSPAAWRSGSTRATRSSRGDARGRSRLNRPAERQRQVSRGFTDRGPGARSWTCPRRSPSGPPGTWCAT